MDMVIQNWKIRNILVLAKKQPLVKHSIART
jgi:hypothetical protein